MKIFQHLTLITLLLTAGVASSMPLGQMLLPSPVSVALTVGQWIIKDRKKVYYIQVRSSARDRHQAIQEGYKLAVEQALGALTLRTVEIKNENLVRNEIIVASAGYVEDSRVVSERQVGNGIEVVLDVWVTESRIADRFLAESRGSGAVDGKRFADTLDSYRNSIATTTKALESVLADYPRRAYSIMKVDTKLQRDGALVVSAYIRWNTEYINALMEVLEHAGPLKPCNTGSTLYDGCPGREKIRIRYPGRWFGVDMSEFGYSNDTYMNALKAGFEQRYPVYRVPIINYVLRTVDGGQRNECRQINLSTLVWLSPNKILEINAVNPTVYEVKFEGLSTEDIRRLESITAEVSWGRGGWGC